MSELPPPFHAGQSGKLDGLEWRITNGVKYARRENTRDLKLIARAPAEVAVSMSWMFLFADFFFQNEDSLYPPEHGFHGGELLLTFIRKAIVGGWEFAYTSLEVDKVTADLRRLDVLRP